MAFKDSLSKDVVEQLEWVKDFIVRNPEKFDMKDWCSPAECGTVGCIGGWMYMGKLKRLPKTFSEHLRGRTIIYVEKLQDYRAAFGWLFDINYWPYQFLVNDSTTTPELAVKRIDYFLEHGR